MRAVSAGNRKGFLADCDTLDLQLSQHLAEPGVAMSHVWFPATALLSQLALATPTSGLEVCLAGDEGMVGATIALGVAESPLQVIVQGAGTSLRMEGGAFMGHVGRNPMLDRMLRRYLYVQMVQLARAAVCNRFHVVEQRLARWLLMMQDRARSDSFHMTHEYLATMIGVRRVGVTQAATALQKRGLIVYRRGEIVVLDRRALERAACPCYKADLKVYARVMGRG